MATLLSRTALGWPRTLSRGPVSQSAGTKALDAWEGYQAGCLPSEREAQISFTANALVAEQRGLCPSSRSNSTSAEDCFDLDMPLWGSAILLRSRPLAEDPLQGSPISGDPGGSPLPSEHAASLLPSCSGQEHTAWQSQQQLPPESVWDARRVPQLCLPEDLLFPELPGMGDDPLSELVLEEFGQQLEPLSQDWGLDSLSDLNSSMPLPGTADLQLSSPTASHHSCAETLHCPPSTVRQASREMSSEQSAHRRLIVAEFQMPQSVATATQRCQATGIEKAGSATESSDAEEAGSRRASQPAVTLSDPGGDSVPHKRQRESSSGEEGGAQKPARRGRGRPRVYDTTVPTPSEPPPDAHAAESGQAKKRRGAKPKYSYATEAEALARRRERNRNTAISSYYKRKAYVDELHAELDALMEENEALRQLDKLSQAAGTDTGRLGTLLEETGCGLETLSQL